MVIGKSSKMTFVTRSFLSHVAYVCSDLLAFEQLEEESIGASWARFSCLLTASTSVSIPDDVALDIFHTVLDMSLEVHSFT
jgi:hypothetical protein